MNRSIRLIRVGTATGRVRSPLLRSALVYAALSIILVASSFVSSGCSGGKSKEGPPAPGPRVLLIGLDGATPEILSGLCGRGETPYLGSLAREGWSGRLKTFQPTLSPLIWNTMATGMEWPRLGIHLADMKKGLGGARVKPAPVWRIASHSELEVAVLNWWVSWPAEQVKGHILSDRAPYYLVGPAPGEQESNLTCPEEWIDELDRLKREPADLDELLKTLGLEPGLGDSMKDNPGLDEVLDHLAMDGVVIKAAISLFEEADPHFTAVLLRGLDVTQHAFWPDPAGPIETADSPVIGAAYTCYDRRVKELATAFRSWYPDGYILVVSDHGMRPRSELLSGDCPADVDPRALLALLGLSRVTIDGQSWRVKAVEPHAFSSDVFFRGDPLETGDGNTDQNQPETGVKRVEPPGVVVDAIIESLARVTTDEGKPLLIDIRRDEELGWCHVRAQVNPELKRKDRLGPEDGSLPLTALGMARMENVPAAQHRLAPDGIFLAAGPMIRHGGVCSEEARLSVADVGPTVLALLGLPAAEDMDGRPFSEMFVKEYELPTAVKNYDHLAAKAAGTGMTDGTTSPPALSSEVDTRRKDELRALGYIQ